MQFLQTCYVGFGSPSPLKSLKSIVCTCKGPKMCGLLSHKKPCLRPVECPWQLNLGIPGNQPQRIIRNQNLGKNITIILLLLSHFIICYCLFFFITITIIAIVIKCIYIYILHLLHTEVDGWMDGWMDR